MLTGGLIAPIVHPCAGVFNLPVTFNVAGADLYPVHTRESQQLLPNFDKAPGVGPSVGNMDYRHAIALDKDLSRPIGGRYENAIRCSHDFRHG